jgi:maltooligosyltrehalose trehalohydrolase
MSDRNTWGARIEPGGVRFRVWAPDARTVEVVPEGSTARHAMQPEPDGVFEAIVPGLGAGDRYRLSLDGGPPMPDPASRFQPEGVHGPSQVVDPEAFAWTDDRFPGVPLEDLVLYELHVGTFTPEGTFSAAAARLPELGDLGVTAVELMPVADFPGIRNWGYDGAALFAPARCYGTPDDLRRFVDVAHTLGLAVHLDVVYNHLGPDGAYAAAFSRRFFSERHRSPWGAGINLDGPHARGVRDFFVTNALHWIREYHLDGLRLDATHAMVDESARHFLAELSARVRAGAGRPVVLMAEDSRNLAHMARPEAEGGWGLDGVWADDFHHEVRVLLAGDQDGYYMDYRGDAADLATIVRRGWLYCGQPSRYLGHPRGTDPSGLAPRRFVFCVQNHDQVGNRAMGERLHHQVEPPAFRAAVALLLCAPQVPLLFMGQEWAASSPFRFFTDHDTELGRLVTRGRREEFRRFAAFADEAARERIPDPQAASTFEASRLVWGERANEPHASMLRLHRALLALRRRVPALRDARAGAHQAVALDRSTLALRREAQGGLPLVLVARLSGAGHVTVPATLLGGVPAAEWTVALSTEESAFAPDARPVTIAAARDGVRVTFARPGAVLLACEGGRA